MFRSRLLKDGKAVISMPVAKIVPVTLNPQYFNPYPTTSDMSGLKMTPSRDITAK